MRPFATVALRGGLTPNAWHVDVLIWNTYSDICVVFVVQQIRQYLPYSRYEPGTRSKGRSREDRTCHTGSNTHMASAELECFGRVRVPVSQWA